MFDSLTDLANCALPDPTRYGLAEKDAYFLGVSTEDRNVRSDAEHSTYLYVSTHRPLGMWFDMDTPHSILGGSHRASVVGTSEPLPLTTLNDFELTPFSARTRAATVVREWDRMGRPTLASATPDGNGGMRRIHLLLRVPEHDGALSRVTFDEEGPMGHACFSEPTPIWDPGPATVVDAVCALLRADRQMIPADFAESQVNRWTRTPKDKRQDP